MPPRSEIKTVNCKFHMNLEFCGVEILGTKYRMHPDFHVLILRGHTANFAAVIVLPNATHFTTNHIYFVAYIPCTKFTFAMSFVIFGFVTSLALTHGEREVKHSFACRVFSKQQEYQSFSHILPVHFLDSFPPQTVT